MQIEAAVAFNRVESGGANVAANFFERRPSPSFSVIV
jgi:hypothetical protein